MLKLAAWMRLTALLFIAGMALTSQEARAVPSFARQTGWDCVKCHMSWLELTNVGRRFKLGGYQDVKAIDDDTERPLVSFNFNDPPPVIPLAMWLQVTRTSTADVSQQNSPDAAGTAADPTIEPKLHDGQVRMQAASLFLNGKLYDGIGCFCQYTYDPLAHQASQDNTEIRFVPDEYKGDGLNVLYGFSLNNNPTMSDIYNTTPVWGWPYLTSDVSVVPTAGTLLAGSPAAAGGGALGHSIAGLTAYSLWNRTVYAELGAYRTADSVLRAVTINNTRTLLDGLAPYYRFALQHDWQNGVQSAEVGTYGFRARIYGDQVNGSGPTDNYTDRGIDAQYQYITNRHRFSAMFNYIRETTDFNASYPAGAVTNPSDSLDQVTLKLSYYYNLFYGVSLGYQRVSGSTDFLRFNGGGSSVSPVTGSLNGSPDSEAKILEFNWLFNWDNSEEFRRNRIIVQYVAYDKFNGASDNYDGNGRRARDNNTLYIAWWSYY